MKTMRRVGRELGKFEFDGHRYVLAYSSYYTNVYVFLDELEDGLAVAKVVNPKSPKRRVVTDSPWCVDQSPDWWRAFKREVSRVCRDDLLIPSALAESATGGPR